MSRVPRVLVVDDEQGIRRVLAVMLRKEGCAVDTAGGRAELETLLAGADYDLLITDMRMPDLTGLEVLRLARERSPGLPSIVMTAYPSADATIQAIQKGALDFVTKEGDYLDRLRRLVREGIARGREEPAAPLAVPAERRTDYLVGSSPAMLEIFKVVGRVADRKSTVLITGESGTGKELVARAIHAHSGRRDRPLVSINCGAITETLLESELFGHVKGSFTGAVADKKGLFEAADGGTLFLDEIGETTRAVQVKLLRVLQEETVRRVGDTRDIPVDVRIIAATNQDLAALAHAGGFREDLFFRLNVIPVHVPPLRERPEDVTALVRYFLDRFGASGVELAPEALEAVLAYPWPGNVRELENVLERVVAMHPGETIQTEFLPEAVRRGGPPPGPGAEEPPPIPPGGLKLEEELDAYERRLIQGALAASGGRRAEAARLLGLTLRSFRYRADKHGL